MIKELREFFMTCPLLEESSDHGFVIVGVDFLEGSSASYSIESTGGAVWEQRFQGGNHGIKRLDFVFSSMEAYTSEDITTLQNLDFYDKFNEWAEITKPPSPMIEIALTRPTIQFVVEGLDLARYQIAGTLLYRA